jgi:glycosyltransferase involved in cell wall biosynthesis
MPPLVSVMIGVYNGAPYLAEAIDSVLAQTYEPLELIVVDDGSDDGSAEVARGYGDALRYAYQENAGNGSARNHATRLARGDVFAFMDADDRSSADRLALQWAAFESDPELDVVYGHVREFVSPELTPEQQATVRPPNPDAAPWVSVNLMMIKRESFERVGPFSETLRVGVTVDWCARAGDAGLKSATLPQVLLERRLHLTNNGIRERDAKSHYARVMKAALDRRRALAKDSD